MISEAFFTPRTVAVIGATSRLGFGQGIFRFLLEHGYSGRVFPVNPREKELFGQKVYASVTEIPGEVELALIVIPAPAVPGAVRECVRKGIRSIIIESAGFSETGAEGRTREDEIRGIIQGTLTRIIGPNCVGVMNPQGGFATDDVCLEDITPGNIAVVAQSGVFGNILMDWAPSQDLRLSKVITIGNRLDVDEVDLLEYLEQDDLTDVIVLYMEGVKTGPRFLKTASRVASRKPVLVLKSGRTQAGQAATASHTGSLSGDDAIYEAVFSQCGLIRASNFQELFDMARIMASQPLPQGPELAIVTTSGSLGAMTADAAVGCGLSLPAFAPATIHRVREAAPDWMNVRNPLDVGPSSAFPAALAGALEDRGVHSLILIPAIPRRAMQSLPELDMDTKIRLWLGDPPKLRRCFPQKPVIAFTMGAPSWTADLRAVFGADIPLLHSLDSAARAISELYRFGLRRHQTDLRQAQSL